MEIYVIVGVGTFVLTLIGFKVFGGNEPKKAEPKKTSKEELIERESIKELQRRLEMSEDAIKEITHPKLLKFKVSITTKNEAAKEISGLCYINDVRDWQIMAYYWYKEEEAEKNILGGRNYRELLPDASQQTSHVEEYRNLSPLSYDETFYYIKFHDHTYIYRKEDVKSVEWSPVEEKIDK